MQAHDKRLNDMIEQHIYYHELQKHHTTHGEQNPKCCMQTQMLNVMSRMNKDVKTEKNHALCFNLIRVIHLANSYISSALFGM